MPIMNLHQRPFPSGPAAIHPQTSVSSLQLRIEHINHIGLTNTFRNLLRDKWVTASQSPISNAGFRTEGHPFVNHPDRLSWRKSKRPEFRGITSQFIPCWTRGRRRINKTVCPFLHWEPVLLRCPRLSSTCCRYQSPSLQVQTAFEWPCPIFRASNTRLKMDHCPLGSAPLSS